MEIIVPNIGKIANTGKKDVLKNRRKLKRMELGGPGKELAWARNREEQECGNTKEF